MKHEALRMNTQSYRSIFLLGEENFTTIYPENAVAGIQRLTRNDGHVYERDDITTHPERFADVQLIFSGWGAPIFDEELLQALPSLEAVFYGAGSVRKIVTEAFWAREILLTSAYQVNAVPVAEFTVASVIFSLKRAFFFNRSLREGVDVSDGTSRAVPGAYRGSKVGIISLGAIGCLVCEMLARHDIDVLAYDPFAGDDVFSALGVKRVNDLRSLFKVCDVVSLHTPWLKETENMITGDLLRAMPEDATFINTSRGAVVNEVEMLEVLRERSDLFAVLDVLADEETYHTNALTGLPNVFVTPHIAGSLGRECHRMGDAAVEECRRYLNGEPPMCGLNQRKSMMLA